MPVIAARRAKTDKVAINNSISIDEKGCPLTAFFLVKNILTFDTTGCLKWQMHENRPRTDPPIPRGKQCRLR